MSPWKWSPERSQGIWRYGSPAIRPFVAASPWVTLLVILFQFWIISGALVTAKGVLFDLPETSVGEGEATDHVALIVPSSRETLIFFDDARYLPDDPASLSVLSDHLKDAASKRENFTLLVLADRRVNGGELMKFAALARQSGVKKILFAEKQSGGVEE